MPQESSEFLELMLNTRYTLIPGFATDLSSVPEAHALRQKAIQFLFEFWQQTFHQLGVPDAFNPDELLRQHVFAVFHTHESDPEIIAVVCYSFWNLDSAPFYHSYWSRLGLLFIKEIQQKKWQNALSFEFMSPAKNWMQQTQGRVINIIANVSYIFISTQNIDGAIASIRSDISFIKYIYNTGGVGILKNDIVYGIPTDMVLWERPNIEPYKMPVPARLGMDGADVVLHLWNTRRDFLPDTILKEKSNQNFPIEIEHIK